MPDQVVALLDALGYGAERRGQSGEGAEVVIDRFDPWGTRPNLAVTTACNCVQYPVVTPSRG